MTIRKKGKRLDGYVENYVVFDLETTGINQNLDKIIEISAIKVCSGNVVGQYSTLVNPERSIPKGATAVNGITNQMVQSAPLMGEAIGGFLEFIESYILVGHNIHTFDTNFAYDAAFTSLGRVLDNDYVDTLYMARKCLPQLTHHKLTDVSAYFGIKTEGAHRALNDCIMNQLCFERLGQIRPNKSIKKKECDCSCPLCGSEMVVRKGKFGTFYGCSGYPGCRGTRKV